MFRLSLYPIADSFSLVIVAAVALVALLAFTPGQGGEVRWPRRALISLRFAAILLVVLLMLRPTLIYTETKKQPATFVTLVDQSRSMTAPDEVGGKTRWDILRKTAYSAADDLNRLAADFEIKAYGFDSQTHELKIDGGRIVVPSEPTGEQTAIGAALDDVLRAEAGKRLLGVLLLSDGAQRALAPRDAAPQTAAARLKRLGVPLFAVPFGQSRGLGQAQDVAVEDLLANSSVFVKNELTVSAQIRANGFVNRDLPVRLLFETSPGKMDVVGETTVRPTADGQMIPVQFDYVPQTPGECKLVVEAVPQTGELATTNNQLTTFVNVTSGGLNVLYVEGALRAEQKFIRRSLDSSPDIGVDYVRLDPRDSGARPGDFSERLEPGKYDVYILGDVDASVFEKGELSKLAETINRGAGMIALGGFHSFGPGGYASTPLARVFPVGMDKLERQKNDEPIQQDLHLLGPLKMIPTPLGERHFALRLAAKPDDNKKQWAQLPPLDGANRFHDLAPGAVTLLDDGKDRPLLVAHTYGDGRVMAFAGDSTWRWTMRGFDAAHKRFWRQVILWLAKKDDAQTGSVWAKLDQRRFSPGQRVEFYAGAKEPTGDPLVNADFKAEVVLPDGSKRPVSLVREGEQYVGSFRDAQTPGDYVIEVSVARNGQEYGSVRSRFIVFKQDLELDNASADSAALESLAAATGGKTYPPEQIGDLFKLLAKAGQALEVQQETKKTFWDSWPTLLVLVSLLSVEWYLRKRWGWV